MTPVLGYWSFRGKAQPIRYLLEYTGTKYVDKQYDIGPGPCYVKTEWTRVKDCLGLEIPSLPYYIDDNNRLTDSVTILRYLAQQHHLDGTTTAERNNLEDIVRVINERNGALDMLFYTTNFITFADFMLFEILERYELLDSECLSDFSNLQTFKKHFMELPTIKRYLSSASFRKIKERVNGRMARCGVGWYFGTERNI